MVLLTTTPEILRAISAVPPTSLSSLDPLPTTPGSPITHSTIVALARVARQYDERYSLNSLLRGSKVYVAPPPPKPKPSPEYVALMARLRKEQEMREYHALVSKAADMGAPDDESEQKDDVTPSLVFNILLSIVMCGAAVFYMTRWWPNDAVRVLVSLFVAIVVGVAEVVVYAGYLRKVERSRDKERRIREKKELIGPYLDPQTDIPEDSRVVDEKDEIWGRGINGGMRRRVREKWGKEQAS